MIPFVLGKLFPISGMSRHRKPPNISKRLKEAEFRQVRLSQSHHPFRGSDSSLLASTVRRILKVIKHVFVYEYLQKTTAQNGIGLDSSGRKEQETMAPCGKPPFSARVRCTMLSRNIPETQNFLAELPKFPTCRCVATCGALGSLG